MAQLNNKSQVVITVPVYKAGLTTNEEASLLQLFKILGSYQICFTTYQELDFTAYQSLLKGYNFEIVFFKQSYFSSIEGYNALLLGARFYKKFSHFDFILIYQLDAWVFRDELTKWCHEGYDYIGAPWFASDKPESGLPHFLGIGNGGFSLRKVSSHLKVLNKLSYIVSPGYYFWQFRQKPGLKSLKELFLNLTYNNNTHYRLGKSNFHEDMFWGRIIKKGYPWFKAPDMLTAAKFATETSAPKLYEVNKQQLPFGCHAWDKYETEFWRQHIKIAGHGRDNY